MKPLIRKIPITRDLIGVWDTELWHTQRGAAMEMSNIIYVRVTQIWLHE